MADHSLTLGSLLLTDSVPHDDHDYVFNILADGTSFGVAQGVQEVVTSLLADGDLVRITRYGNRQVTFPVEITGPSLASLAHGEAALRAEIGRGNTLTWQAPDVLAVPTVFEVVTSEMAQTFDDLSELRRRRTFTVTLTCSPSARSVDLTTVDALEPPPGSPTTTTINDATSTAEWSAHAFSSDYSGGDDPITVTDLGADGVSATATATNVRLLLKLTPAAPVPLAGSSYLLLTLGGDSPFKFTVFYSDGTLESSASVRSARAISATQVQYVLLVDPAKSITTVTIWADAPPNGQVSTLVLSAFDVSHSDTLPQITARQTTSTFEVGGTERTPGSIRVATDGSPMNFTFVHTSPKSLTGYSPPLRRWRVNGNTETPDSNLFSGAREPVNLTAIEAQVPSLSMPPGEYVLAAVMRSDTVGTFPITWTANSLIPGYGYLGETVSGVAQATFTDIGFWNLIPLDIVTLPPVRAADALAAVQLTLNRALVGAEVIDLDEWWAFRAGEDCALTIVNNSTSRLWLDSPDITSPVPRVWIGDFDNRNDARHPGIGLIAQGNHILHPDGTSIFLAANGVDFPSASATFHKRWHSNAAEDS